MRTDQAPSGDPLGVLGSAPPGFMDALSYPYFQSVFDRKSRRVALGMTVGSDVIPYESPYEPVPLSELEEALLVMAGTGLNGLALADLDPVRGMSTLVQWTNRTWPSACSNHGTELFWSNDTGLWMLDMFKMVPEPGEISTLSGKPMEQQADFVVDLYRRAKVQLKEGRAELPTTLPGLFDFNQWNANKPGTSLFVPVTNMTLEYINVLFIYMARGYRFSIVDEQRGWESAGLQKWVDEGRLDPARRMGMVELEQRVLSMLVVEQAFICQNMNLALQALGLGGWTFTGYLPKFVMGGGDVPGLGFRFLEDKQGNGFAVGRDGHFEAFTPPYHKDMREAVDAFMAMKWSAMEEDVSKPYKDNDAFVKAIPRPHEETVEIVKDYCQYVWDTYGRFPAYIDPMYQRLTCQAQHVDPDFYEEYFPEGSISGQHKHHFERWHPDTCGSDGKPPRR
ncbi:MAG: hypothetical protein H6531_01475 [Actinobacteria bacterium]|nr:hypothetical protein [Thermoleophilia bacterium]MCB9010481.1 hypothetical protein [Actinomycetota bacterium]